MAGRTVEFHVARTYGPLEAPPPRNLIMASGETVRLLLTIFERDGDAAPLNLAGAYVSFEFNGTYVTGSRFGGDGEIIDFAAGQVAYELTAPECWGRLPWRCSLCDAATSSVLASGTINVMPAPGHRTAADAGLITSDGQNLDGYGPDIAVPSAEYKW